ncbi:MAG TPA: hypothetical protein VKZ53_06750 [Candidatus Angelobacter sp.]|nr:hypothetical protein [Candidatus Angelobacter sp.]
MIAFNLKTGAQKHGGLNIGLCPGIYEGKQSREKCIYVSEAAFGFLEPDMRKHSSKFARPYSHWGITEISRDEWQAILRNWNLLRQEFAMANTIEEICHIHPVGLDRKDEFGNDFDRNKFALLKMIDELSDWVSVRLVENDQITVLGI